MRCSLTAMTEALAIAATGLTFGKGSNRLGPGGRKLSYTAKVHGNGSILIGKAYTKKLGLNIGDEFEIRLSKKAIRLVPVGSTEEEE